MAKVATVLECDQCKTKFQGHYEDEFETPDDAAWFVSCHGCGAVLCPRCKGIHSARGCEDGTEWLAVVDEFNRRD
jgi:primosomal protein N'